LGPVDLYNNVKISEMTTKPIDVPNFKEGNGFEIDTVGPSKFEIYIKDRKLWLNFTSVVWKMKQPLEIGHWEQLLI
jgi:hypothetical protein